MNESCGHCSLPAHSICAGPCGRAVCWDHLTNPAYREPWHVTPSRVPIDRRAWSEAVERGLRHPPPSYCHECVIEWVHLLGEEVIANDPQPCTWYGDPVLDALEDLATRTVDRRAGLPDDWERTLLDASRRAFGVLERETRCVATWTQEYTRWRRKVRGVRRTRGVEVVCLGAFSASRRYDAPDRSPWDSHVYDGGFEQWIDRDGNVYQPSRRGIVGSDLEPVVRPATSPFYYEQGWSGAWPHPATLLRVLAPMSLDSSSPDRTRRTSPSAGSDAGPPP